MSNAGRYIDRCPVICAAGKSTIPNTTAKVTLQEYNLSDKVDALKHDLKIFNEKELDVPYRLPQIENVRHRGANDRILKHLTMPKKTRYQQLVTDLKETTYRSYWGQPLGQPADPVPGLPQGMDTVTTTFGHKPLEHVPLYEVVFPRIPRYQVLWNSQVNHDKYKKIYNDYNVGEKMDRNYFKPPYNPENCFGYKTKNDERGLGARCAMNWFNIEPVTIASSRQVDYWDKYHLKMGEVHAPIGIKDSMPKTHTYGKPYKMEMHGMAELLRPGCEPGIQKRDALVRMASLNMLRQNIKKRFTPSFTLNDLYAKLAYYDKDMSNFITLRDFYQVIGCLKIKMNRENLEDLFRQVGIVQSDKIDYRRFVDALSFDMEFEKQLDPLPEEKLHYCTESAASRLDHYFIDNSKKPAAGLSSYRFDLKYPPKKGCESEREDLPTDDVKTLVDRSIFLQYNISYRDMFKGRSKEFIKTLFENCGYQFAEGAFEELYQLALAHDKTGSVCVDTFNKIVKQHQLPMKKIVDELACIPEEIRKPCACV
ncbi:EF-hand domain-containing family member B [Coccinella septempunctata]|uniref:EF-hand domain-containing family member B n=1 Tax=Coccinella septempunctata TaxID=41139 RepID=UPI001D090B2A|nr:EF-hand domain-containing family member B [Coccinella septempunctata]